MYMKLNLCLFISPVTQLFLHGKYAHIFLKPVNTYELLVHAKS